MREFNESRMVKGISRLGLTVRVQTADGWQEGRGVLYPLRQESSKWGSVTVCTEGVAQEQRYLLFCPRELLAGCQPGDEIVQDSRRFRLIWKDDFVCRWGSYVKACLRKMSEEDADEQ